MSGVRVYPSGDACLVVEFEQTIDPAINARCVSLAERIRLEIRFGLRDVVPTYQSVAVYFEPERIDREGLRKQLNGLAAGQIVDVTVASSPIEVPVCYGGRFGPDLPDVAEFAGCSEEDVIKLHTGALYQVYMLGFLPGFAYMGRIDARLEIPRLPAPRLRVPAGSVEIAGAQTGIHPVEAPGGWRLIGRTALKPFDLARAEPCLFRPGDRVKFVSVHEQALDRKIA